MLAGLKFKLAMGLLLLAAISFLGLYMDHQKKQIKNLTSENTVLIDDNKELADSLKEVNRRQGVSTEVTKHFDVERQQNRVNRDKKNEQIQNQVNTGEDKPVGKLLKDFLNAE